MPPLPVAPNTPTLPVAVLLPTSGEMAVFGQQLRHGIEMAFDEANNTGGILGRRIQWQFYDTECNDQSTALAVQQAVDDGYLLMIGPLCAASAITAAEYADTEQFLLMVPAAAHPLVTVNGIGETRPTVFRMSHPLPAPGQAIAQFAIDQLHAASSAVITEIGNESSVAAGQAFADQFSSFGGKILAQTALNPYHPDFTTQVEFVLDQRSQALFLSGSPELVNRVASLQNDFYPTDSEKPVLLGGVSWFEPEIERGLVEAGYFAGYFALPPEHRPAQTWVQAYKATYAIQPDVLAGLGYETASILLAAIRQSQNSSPAAVADTLQNNTFSGLVSPVRFDRQHNPVKAVPVLQISAGQTVFVTTVNIR